MLARVRSLRVRVKESSFSSAHSEPVSSDQGNQRWARGERASLKTRLPFTMRRAGLEKLHCLRVSNVSPAVDTEILCAEFSKFGELGDFFRPTNQGKMIPTQYIFVRYVRREDADAALVSMNGRVFDDRALVIVEAKQESFFTQDTGYITNSAFDTPQVTHKEFDSSMPASHYEKRREAEIKEVEVTFTLRVYDIHKSVTQEQILAYFRQFGEINSIYYPINLKENAPRGFALIRFLHPQDAERALQESHDSNAFGIGRRIQVEWAVSKTYFSTDETKNAWSV